ncbi:MAG: hypothetical protein AAFX39_05060 [Pseudomonadota bacterium]
MRMHVQMTAAAALLSIPALAGLTIFPAPQPAAALDLETLETRTIYGLRGPSGARDISNVVLDTTPLAEEGIASLAGRSLRTRFWTINGNGGIVPIHNHANRPAVFTILTGEIYEYVNTANERILHKAGGLALEEGRISHWWLNDGEEDVHLIAFDVFQSTQDLDTVTVGDVPAAADFELPETQGARHDLLGVVNIASHFDSAFGEGWALTTYRTTIEPGGVFPAFTTAGEPVQMFVWRGQVTEHRSDVGDPLTIDAEGGSTLSGGALAWWENTGDEPAVLYFGVVEPIAETEGVERVGTLAHGSHQ